MNSRTSISTKWSTGCLLALLGVASMGNIHADTLWSNGDLDFQSGLVSTTGPAVTGIVYDDFNVTSPYGWNVTGVAGNFYYTTDLAGTTANWEIRSGISSGNPGTLIASGTGTVALTSMGTYQPTTTPYNVEHVSLTGLNVNLTPGTYWVGIQPITTSGYGFLGSTSGSNAIGTPAGNDANAYATRPDQSQYFKETTTIDFAGHDYSLSVSGSSAVPEPAQWIWVPLVGLAILLWKRRAA